MRTRSHTEDTTEPRSILHVASGDLMAGAESMLENLCRAQLDTPGQQVHAALLNHGTLADRLSSMGVAVQVHDELRHGFLGLLRRLLRQIRMVSPSVVHTHRTKENILGAVAAKYCGVPSIRTVHGATENKPSLLRIDRQLIRGMDTIAGNVLQASCVAVSAELAVRLKQIHPRWRVNVVNNGIDEAEVRARARAALPMALPDADVRFGYFGRLAPVKRVDRIINAIRLFCGESQQQVSLLIVGDGPLRSQLEDHTRDAGLADQVRFLGFVDNPLPILRCCNALILASDHEGLPMCVLESLAIGVPVLAPRIGGIIDAVGDSSGVLFEPVTAESLAKSMQSLIDGTPQKTVVLPDCYTSHAMECGYRQIYEMAMRMRNAGNTAPRH